MAEERRPPAAAAAHERMVLGDRPVELEAVGALETVAQLADQDPHLALARRAPGPPARAKRSHDFANDRKSVRPPQRCAASIGQTPPSPST